MCWCVRAGIIDCGGRAGGGGWLAAGGGELHVCCDQAGPKVYNPRHRKYTLSHAAPPLALHLVRPVDDVVDREFVDVVCIVLLLSARIIATRVELGQET